MCFLRIGIVYQIINYIIYCPNSNIISWSTNVLYSISPSNRGSSLGSIAVFSCHSSSASVSLEEFHRLSWFFKTLTFLKNTIPLPLIFLILWLSDVSMWLNLFSGSICIGYVITFWGSHNWSPITSVCPSLEILLVTWSRCCLSLLLCTYCFLNSSSWLTRNL